MSICVYLYSCCFTLLLFHIAMEHGTFIDDLPTICPLKIVILHSYVK